MNYIWDTKLRQDALQTSFIGQMKIEFLQHFITYGRESLGLRRALLVVKTMIGADF
jgi:hypothetical protein